MTHSFFTLQSEALQIYPGDLYFIGTTPIHLELGCETMKGQEELLGGLTGISCLLPGWLIYTSVSKRNKIAVGILLIIIFNSIIFVI